MSQLWSRTYDYAAPVTKDNVVDDPQGPFAGLLVSAAGTVVVWCRNGRPADQPLTINVIAGQELHFPIKRIGTASSATVLGLVSAIVPQGS